MQPISLNKTGQYTIIQLSESYKNVEYIRTFTDDIAGIGILIKQFRWSINNTVWSYWIELTQDNLISLELDPDNELYIEYKYQLATQGNIIINAVKIEPSYKLLDPNIQIIEPSLLCSSCGIDRSTILTTCNSTFNPYSINPAINLYKDLSASIQDIFGMDVMYLKAIPKEKSGDVIFKEWTLYAVDDPICTKIMVQNNEFPSNDNQYDSYGIGYEQPFEVEIVKENFERDFGLDTIPQKNDIIFFSINPDHLYEIQSTSPVKGFMMEITSWKCELTIYKPKSNRDLPETVKDIMDDLMYSSDELFGEEISKDIKDIVNPQQFDRSLGTTHQDHTRLYINQLMNIIDAKLYNHSTNISDHYYDLSSIFTPNKINIGVKYHAISNFNANQNFAFTSWNKFIKPKYNIASDSCKITHIQGNELTVTISKTRSYAIGSLVNIFRQGRLNFYGIINEIINNNTFKVILSNEIISYLNSISATWMSATGYSMKLTFSNTLINGYGTVGTPGENKGWKLESFVNQYFLFTINDNNILITLPEILNENNWYGIVLNYASTFKQINFSIWEINSDKKTNNSNLIQVFTQTINNIESENKDFCGNFYIPACNMYQTNIRIWKEIIPQEQQSTVLNQYIVGDGYEAIVIDNALPILKLPYLGRTK